MDYGPWTNSLLLLRPHSLNSLPSGKLFKLTIINHVVVCTIAQFDLGLFQAFGNTCTVTVVLVAGGKRLIGEYTFPILTINDAYIVVIYNILNAQKYFV